jgi:hypothetical protein
VSPPAAKYAAAMSLPMVGTWTVRVADVRPFTIHGDLYYELLGVRADDGSNLSLRVPQHAVAEPPAAGQLVAVTFLMGQVTGVARVQR